MPNHAHIHLIGHLGRAPELKTSKTGNPYATFSLAVNTGFGDNRHTSWWDVTLFGAQADVAASKLQKGDPVCIEGEPSIREYTRQDGTKGKAAEVIARRFVFLRGRDDAEPRPTGEPAQQAEPPQAPRQGDLNDDIPF
jgi:single-strand DNA-binding protein